ncbi:sensor histidine kinase [Paenibacillus mendelii]|uniref:histidine kinase n=1 Tax=Paenibacillus mendelii TaxID=206163 RepID=A0ABV6JED0_9BACL|nr:ATP-binding protein [Paenibacillus mendelii]MCQ6557137.1 ATP-binding protein [Paenibacillus mendelii]
MKRFNRISLRLRLTIVIALILILASTVLMAVSIYSARNIYSKVPLIEMVANGEISAKRPLLRDQPGLAVLRVEQDNEFASISLLSVVLVVVIGTGITYLIVGRALKPVTNLARKIEEIDENNLFRPVNVTPSNDEVSKLSVSFNHMIAKLEKAFNSQKNFSANAAHELKTPLAAMIANIEVLQLDANPTLDEYKETLDDALYNAQRLSSLVNDLLKVNAELHITTCEKIDANAIFESIIDDLRPELQNKSIQIENLTGGAQLYGDKLLLHRAFNNLIHNAVKYNKPGGLIKIVATETDDKTRIAIFDTGIGIPDDQIEKIFDPFYCVDPSRSRELGGSGLGLSIVKSVIDKHGGEIKVQSIEDISTTFVIFLPKP